MSAPNIPQAFPCLDSSYGQLAMFDPGMTLRDAFALAIAGGMASHSGTMGISFGPSEIAMRSYEVAEAMIEVRANLDAPEQRLEPDTGAFTDPNHKPSDPRCSCTDCVPF